ncbi:MAG: hypothetical protein JSS87_06570 [Acidobacteria bacterium]|nr:hypothetical protein [Acidobacteriota bacterium]
MRRDSLRRWSFPAAILFAGFLLRIWLILRHAVIQNDSNLYAEIAQNWAHFGTYGFSTDTFPRPTLIRLPGYPIFLIISSVLFGWIFGIDSFTAPLTLQLLLDLSGCVLLATTVHSAALRSQCSAQQARRAALITLFVADLCPFTANYVATPLTECATNFTIMLALFAVERWSAVEEETGDALNRYLVLLACALSYSLLLRPDQVLLATAFIPAMLWRTAWNDITPKPLGKPVVLKNALESRLRRRMRAIPQRLKTSRGHLSAVMITLLLTVLPLVPWTMRNWHSFHVFQPLAPRSATDPGEGIPKGFQHWYRTWAVDFASTEEFYWKYPDEPLDADRLPNRAFDNDDQFDRTVDLIEDSNNLPHLHPEIDARFEQLARERVAADPMRYYVLLPVARLFNMLFHPRTEMWPYDLRWWKYSQHPAQTLISYTFVLLNIAFFIAGAFGFRKLMRRAPRLAIACGLYIILRCALLLTMDNAEQRYTIEFFPMLILMIGALALNDACGSSPSKIVAE